MSAPATRLTAPDFARLIHRHQLSADDVREQGIIVPKAFAADVVFAAGDEEKRISEWVMSTATPDRRGDTIQVKGWQLANFRKGGSILFAHDGRSLPVGRPLKVWKDTEALRLRMEHAPAEANPIAEQVFQSVKGKFLRGSSVGFIPEKWEFINDEEPWADGINFLKQELVEHSLVPVPQNPEALLVAVGKGLDVDLKLFTDWQRMALDGEIPSLGAYREDIAASLKALTGNPVSASVPSDPPKDAPATKEEAGENPFLNGEYRRHLEEFLAERGLVKSESAGGAATGVAASQPPAESAASSVDQAAAATPAPSDATAAVEFVNLALGNLAKAAPGYAQDTEAAARIKDAMAALVAVKPTEEGAEAMDITKHIDALAQAARDGDADALERLRALATQVNCAAQELAEPNPEDVVVFEITSDDDQHNADDLIEFSAAEIKAEIAKQVAQQTLAQTGRI